MSRLLLAAALSLSAIPALAQPLDGKALFHQKCGMCHEAGGMGTGLLARRVQPAELEKRTNLNADFVFQYARRGFANMPPVTPGDANDAELRAIGQYLANKGPK